VPPRRTRRRSRSPHLLALGNVREHHVSSDRHTRKRSSGSSWRAYRRRARSRRRRDGTAFRAHCCSDGDGRFARSDKLTLPYQPFIGTIGTSPEIEAITSLQPDYYGGNGSAGRRRRCGDLSARQPSAELKRIGFSSLDNLFAVLDDVLVENDLKVWVLLDRLDVAFVENHELEANALRALIRAYADLKSRDQISIKIFLREDIWKRITEKGMREASHLIRYVILDWTQPALLNLILRRLLNNSALVKEFGIDATSILEDAAKQEDTFYRFFPQQVEQGPQKAQTFKWLVTRCADGTGKTAPRELIHLLNCILEQEIRRLENGGAAAANDQLFDRSVFKSALPTVSDARLNQYLYAEYASERPFVSKLEGQKAEQTSPVRLSAQAALN